MRKITFKVVKDMPLGIVITDQTHRCDNFVPGGRVYFATDGTQIASASFPANESQYAGIYYVRGRSVRSDDAVIKMRNAKELLKVCQAIHEYNYKFGGANG